MLIAVLPKGALFIGDDIALLRICCRETAVQLDNTAMMERQQALIDELELTFQAGTHQDAVTMSAADYIKLTQPMIGHFARHKH